MLDRFVHRNALASPSDCNSRSSTTASTIIRENSFSTMAPGEACPSTSTTPLVDLELQRDVPAERTRDEAAQLADRDAQVVDVLVVEARPTPRVGRREAGEP